MIKEQSIKIEVVEKDIVSKDLPVFYNKVMESNRSISILLLQEYFKSIDKPIIIADALAGSGIRSLRMIKEWLKDKDYEILINDMNPLMNETINNAIKNNFTDDEIKNINSKIEITNKDANLAMLEHKYFDYIDIDPFGSPNQFLDAAIKRMKHKGVLAITATDTAPLAGTYSKTCKRKYYAKPLRNYLMHEIGLRILIRKAQLIGVQYEKALVPILSYSTDHYMRIFFKIIKSKSKCDEILKQHKYVNEKGQIVREESFGPLWTGELYDKKLINSMIKNNPYDLKKMIKLLTKIYEEYDSLGFYDSHALAKKNSIEVKSMKMLIETLKSKRFKASKTHFNETGIKSDCSYDDFIEILKE